MWVRTLCLRQFGWRMKSMVRLECPCFKRGAVSNAATIDARGTQSAFHIPGHLRRDTRTVATVQNGHLERHGKGSEKFLSLIRCARPYEPNCSVFHRFVRLVSDFLFIACICRSLALRIGEWKRSLVCAMSHSKASDMIGILEAGWAWNWRTAER